VVFRPTFAAEKLFEREKIKVHQETLRKWLIESGDWKRVRKGPIASGERENTISEKWFR
jgi:hypothetical protein